jgi:hypothetical protein
MAVRQLSELILDDDQKFIKFFNGRLLSGEDLSREQASNREARRRTGLAIGYGIAKGLEVTIRNRSRQGAMVQVAKGMAVNRHGHIVTLPETVDLALIHTRTVPPPGQGARLFQDCDPITGVYVAGADVYLLTICPAEGEQGRAQVSGLGTGHLGCNAKYLVEGVRFRLLKLNLSLTELSDQAPLRNRVAYQCFGMDELKAFEQTPFGPRASGYGLIDRLRRENQLTDCEVPLALVSWRDEGIQFVDMWSVRRRIIQPSANGDWDYTIGDRRRAEAEAMVLQFQEQIKEVPTPQTRKAGDIFRYLPPVGVLPLSDVMFNGQYEKLFNKATDGLIFFKDKTYRSPAFIEGARVEALMRDALAYPPIDLSNGEMVWLYLVRENIEAIQTRRANGPTPFMILVNGHMPFVGETRFDLSRWDYSNYTSVLLGVKSA